MARSAGVAFARTASLNDDPGFLGLLADVVQRAADADGRTGRRWSRDVVERRGPGG